MQKVKTIDTYPYIHYTKESYDEKQMLERSYDHHSWMEKRRTVRDFSDRPKDKKVIEQIILSASTAPSGAHKQPWTFCVVSDPGMKKQIREAAEKEEFPNRALAVIDEDITNSMKQNLANIFFNFSEKRKLFVREMLLCINKKIIPRKPQSLFRLSRL